VTTEAIVRYRERHLARCLSPGTVNKEVKALGTMFNWAVRAQIIGSNPLKGIKWLRHDDPKEGRALMANEVERLLAASGERYRKIWYCLLTTGLRKSECGALQFKDIDWENRELVVQRGVSKTHRSRRIPIDDALYEIFMQARNEASKRVPSACPGKSGRRLVKLFTQRHVFVTRYNTPFSTPSLLYSRLIAHCQKAGIETRRVDSEGNEIDHVDVHSLRRTFATELIINGTDPKTVQELLGHRTLEMTMNLYAKVHTGTKRQALGRLSWGAGAKPPEHLVKLPFGEEVGHKMSTVTKSPSGATAQPVAG